VAIRYLLVVLPFARREASMACAAASTVALWLLAGDYEILAGVWVTKRRRRQRLLQDDTWRDG